MFGDMIISPIYETVHPVYGRVEFKIFYYIVPTEKFVAWIQFFPPFYTKASWNFDLKFWLKGSLGQIGLKTDKKIVVNEKYLENMEQGTIRCKLPETLYDSDYLIVCLDFPFVATTPKTVGTHHSFEINFTPMDGYLVFHDSTYDYPTKYSFKFELLPNIIFTYHHHCGYINFKYEGKCPKGVTLEFTVWVKNLTGTRTAKIVDNFRMCPEIPVYTHNFTSRQLIGRFGLEDIVLCCSATAWIEETKESEYITGIAELYGDKDCGNLEIKVKDKKFKISKAIVAAHTNALDGIAVIDDVDVEMFELMLRFMYSNKVENLDSVAFNLLVVANRFKVDDLVELCVESIFKNMNLTSVVDRLKFFGEISQLDEYKHHIAGYTQEWIGKMATINP
ncbi:hypothetical protein M3Y94_01027100 [Aphelenchoides besseyi]|nr:hypothetical protein M3Y94_01027100 [Aphelenchoides besseyi]